MADYIVGNLDGSAGVTYNIGGLTPLQLNTVDTVPYVAGSVVKSIHYRIFLGPTTDTTYEFFLYEKSDFASPTGAVKVWSRVVTVTPADGSDTMIVVDVPDDVVSATPGTPLAVGITSSSNSRYSGFRLGAATTTRSTADTADTGPATWTETGTLTRQLTIAVTLGDAGPTLTDIDDPVLDGEANNSATYINFTNPPNTGTIDGVPLPSISAAAGTITWGNLDVSAITSDAGTLVPSFGTVTVEFTNTTDAETASITTTNTVKAGHEVVTLASIETVDPNALYQMMLAAGTTIANGETIYYDTQGGNVSISAAGYISSIPTTFPFIYINSSNVGYPFVFDNNGVSPGEYPDIDGKKWSGMEVAQDGASFIMGGGKGEFLDAANFVYAGGKGEMIDSANFIWAGTKGKFED